jgi:trehalose monomycolate/heme transporter
MSGRLAAVALERPRAMLIGTLVALVLAAVLAYATVDRLPLTPQRATGSASDRAADGLRAALGSEADPGMVIVTSGRDPVDSGVYEVALDVISSQVETNPHVAEVRRGPVARDGRTTALRIYFADDDAAAQQRAVAELQEELDPGPLDIQVGGEAAILRDARNGLWGELGLLELLALPLFVLVLVIAFGVRLAAGPVLAAAIGGLGSIGLMGLVGAPLSALGIAPAAVIALVVGIEACYALSVRYRDEAAAHGPGETALRATIAAAGRSIAIASFAAAGVAGSAAVIPVPDARSAALGGALAALLSGGAALAAMPSLLMLSTPAGVTAGAGSENVGEGQRRFWYRLESAITAHRAIAAALVALPVAALIAAAAPGLRAKTVPIDAAGLPDDAESREAEARVVSELGAITTAPVLVPGDSVADAELRDLRRRLGRLAGVADTEGPDEAGSNVSLVTAGADARPGSLGAREVVERIRATAAPLSDTVGGRDAEALDADRELPGHLAIAASVAVLFLALLLFGIVRWRSPGAWSSALQAAPLALASLLPAAAATGLTVLVFQDGRVTGLLGYTPQGGPVLAGVIAAVSALAAIAAARTVHYAAALAEERDIGFRSRAIVPLAGSRTLPGVAAATIVAAAATLVLAGAGLVAAKQFGTAVAVGLILDLVLVRALLAPALARLSQ